MENYEKKGILSKKRLRSFAKRMTSAKLVLCIGEHTEKAAAMNFKQAHRSSAAFQEWYARLLQRYLHPLHSTPVCGQQFPAR